MLADLAGWFSWIGCFVLVLLFFFFFKWTYFEDDKNSENKDVEKDQSKRRKFNTPKFNLPKFKDSGWVLFYVICGWISLVLMIVFFAKDNSTFAFMMLGCSLSCFFAAHILRVQEKAAFFAEQSVEESKKQTELLEKISSEKSPIIEDKEK